MNLTDRMFATARQQHLAARRNRHRAELEVATRLAAQEPVAEVAVVDDEPLLPPADDGRLL